MKKYLALILSLAMLLSLCACGGSGSSGGTAASGTEPSSAAAGTESSGAEAETSTPAEAEKPVITLKLGHGNPIDEPVSVYTQNWADAVSEATDGRITITIYPAGQLGTLNEMLEGVQYGTLDMCFGDASLLSTWLPAMGVANLPMLLDSYDVAQAYYDGELGTGLNEKLAETVGIRPLGWYWNYFRQIGTKKPITSVADCANIKLRSPEAALYMDTFNLLGMKPTPLPWNETYSAYESGVVDGMETTTIAMATGGYAEIGGNVCISNHMLSVNAPCINESVWQSIPVEDQELMLRLLKEQIAAERQFVLDSENGYIEEMEAKGINVTRFEDPQELIDLFTPYWTEYAQKNDCMDTLTGILALK